jgi:hypothetical protein
MTMGSGSMQDGPDMHWVVWENRPRSHAVMRRMFGQCTWDLMAIMLVGVRCNCTGWDDAAHGLGEGMIV